MYLYSSEKTKAMKKLIAIAIFVVAGVSFAQAQKTAKIEFKSETVDYGEIKKNSETSKKTSSELHK